MNPISLENSRARFEWVASLALLSIGAIYVFRGALNLINDVD